MPALVRLARRIVDLLGSDDACGVVDRQVHRQDVADCGLSDQALLRRNAHAHLRVRVEEPQRVAIEQDSLAGVACRLHVLDQIAKLASRQILLGKYGERVVVPRYLGQRLARPAATDAPKPASSDASTPASSEAVPEH